MVRKAIQFIRDVWWFCRHWNPVRVKWNSPATLWRMAMRREAIRRAVQEQREGGGRE